MIIRKWDFKDNIEIAELEKKFFPEPWNVKMLGDTYVSNTFLGFVAEEEGKIIGYIGSIYCLESGEIAMIAVDDSHRRQGLATKLLNKLSVELKLLGVNEIFLEVRRSNYGAQMCYVRNGYGMVAIRPEYYQGKEDALVMKKNI